MRNENNLKAFIMKTAVAETANRTEKSRTFVKQHFIFSERRRKNKKKISSTNNRNYYGTTTMAAAKYYFISFVIPLE